MPDLSRLKVLRPGLELGTVKKDRFEPAHALALWLKDCANTVSFDPDSPEMKAYLHGEVLPCGLQGWCLVKAGDFSIGWGKADKIQLKNHCFCSCELLKGNKQIPDEFIEEIKIGEDEDENKNEEEDEYYWN